MRELPPADDDIPTTWQGVAVLCRSADGGSLLMVLQGQPDETPSWAVPGGSMEPGETPEQAAIREAKEETGLDVRVVRPYTVVEGIKAYGAYRVHYFEAEIINSQARAGDPDGLVHRVAWVTAGQLPDLLVARGKASGRRGSFLGVGAAPEFGGETMTRRTVELLATQMDRAWDRLCRWLEGLTDEEFFWEPVPDCWTVYPDPSGRWVYDYAVPDPDPPPFTTIAWRLVHVALCKVMYHEYAFGPGKLTWDELETPHTAADSIALLKQGHARLRRALDELSDADLEQMRFTNWGDQWPTWRLFWAMITHDLHHGAEIGCLRDLYRATQLKKGQT